VEAIIKSVKEKRKRIKFLAFGFLDLFSAVWRAKGTVRADYGPKERSKGAFGMAGFLFDDGSSPAFRWTSPKRV
jgi:hypothetical protein